MKKLVLLSLIAVGMISTTSIAEDIIRDTGKAVGGTLGAGAVDGVPEGVEKCYDATGMPITCGTVGAAGGAGQGAVESARTGSRQE